jgi:hypothetical protein
LIETTTKENNMSNIQLPENIEEIKKFAEEIGKCK